MAERKQVGNRPARFGHAPVRPVHEHRLQRAQILARVQAAFLVHVRERMQRLVDVAGRRVLAVEDGKVLYVVRLGTVLPAEAHHRLAEIHDAIVRGGTGADEVDDGKFRILLQQHRHGARALRGFTTRAARILRDVRTYDDGLAAGAVEGEVPYGAFHAVNAAQAGMLEFGHFAASRDRRHAARLQCLVHHSLYDDCAGGIVGAGLGAEAQELDPRGVDVVLLDQAHDGRCRHRVDAVIRPANAETASHDFAHLRPMAAGPLAPVLEPDPIGRHVGGEA